MRLLRAVRGAFHSLRRSSAPFRPRSALNSFYIKTCRHPFGMAKNYGSKAKGACNQGKEDFKQLTYSRMHSASSATGENVLQWEQLPFSKKMGKCALWGLRGRTPYKAHSTLCVSLLNLLRFLIRSRRSVVSSSSFLIRHRRRKSRN